VISYEYYLVHSGYTVFVYIVLLVGEIRCIKYLFLIPEGKRLLSRPRCNVEDNM
jgi:hypothetical protein